MSVPGTATPQHTQQFLQNSQFPLLKLPETDVWVSARGVRAMADSVDPEQLFLHILQQGINLWEFASSWGNGEPEFQFGQLLVEQIVQGKLNRESLFIMGRLGALDHDTKQWLETRAAQKRPIKEVFTDNAGRQFSIHPKVLEQQLSHSLARLQIDTLDFVALENPPVFTTDLHDPHAPWLPAFLKMETLAREGMLKHFGVVLPATASGLWPDWIPRLVELQETACLQLSIDIADSAFRGIILENPDLDMLFLHTVSLWGQRLTMNDALQRLNWMVFLEPEIPASTTTQIEPYPHLYGVEWFQTKEAAHVTGRNRTGNA